MSAHAHGPRPSGCTPFEEELVNAMRDFVDTTDTPHFDTATIARTARRKRTTAIAGIAAAVVVAGAGTALAAGATGSHPAHRTTAATATASGDTTTVLYAYDNGKTATIPLAGVSSTGARAALVKLHLTPDFTRTPVPHCKQSTVVAVSPHAPTPVHAGDTVHITVCAG